MAPLVRDIIFFTFIPSLFFFFSRDGQRPRITRSTIRTRTLVCVWLERALREYPRPTASSHAPISTDPSCPL